MKVWILMQHVPYEFGCVLGVFDSEDKAFTARSQWAADNWRKEAYASRLGCLNELHVEEQEVR